MATATGQGAPASVGVVEESENRALLEAAAKFGAVESIAAYDPLFVASVPEGRELVSLKRFRDEIAERPDRKTGTATLTTLASFIAHANRHRDPASVVFADDARDKPALLAVYDYQEAGPEGRPRFGTHRARYAFPLSDEWVAWIGASSSPMTQEAFAKFLEDHLSDVLPVGAAEEGAQDFAVELGIHLAGPQSLLTVARGLQVHVGQSVVSAQNLASGEVTISFEETHTVGTASAPVKVPGGFVLGIPVFRGGERYKVPVRLRYRVANRAIAWQLVPYRVDLVFSHAFDEAVEAVRKETELPVFYGKPEA